MYVNDVIILRNPETLLNNSTNCITETFDICIEKSVNKFPGISCVIGENYIFIHKLSAINRILKQFKMEQRIHKSTPLWLGTVLSKKEYLKGDGNEQRMEKMPYQELVGSLL